MEEDWCHQGPAVEGHVSPPQLHCSFLEPQLEANRLSLARQPFACMPELGCSEVSSNSEVTNEFLLLLLLAFPPNFHSLLFFSYPNPFHMSFSHDSKKGYFVVLRPAPREQLRQQAKAAHLPVHPKLTAHHVCCSSSSVGPPLVLMCSAAHLAFVYPTPQTPERSNLMIVDMETFHIIKEIQGITQDMQVREPLCHRVTVVEYYHAACKPPGTGLRACCPVLCVSQSGVAAAPVAADFLLPLLLLTPTCMLPAVLCCRTLSAQMLQSIVTTMDGKYLLIVTAGFQRFASGVFVLDIERDEPLGFIPAPGGHHDIALVPTTVEDMKYTRAICM